MKIIKNLINSKENSLKLLFFHQIQAKNADINKKNCLSVKILVLTLKSKLKSMVFSSFHLIKKVSEFHKIQSLPRIQLIPIEKEQEIIEVSHSSKDSCKEIDRLIIYNQVFALKIYIFSFKI